MLCGHCTCIHTWTRPEGERETLLDPGAWWYRVRHRWRTSLPCSWHRSRPYLIKLKPNIKKVCCLAICWLSRSRCICAARLVIASCIFNLFAIYSDTDCCVGRSSRGSITLPSRLIDLPNIRSAGEHPRASWCEMLMIPYSATLDEG